MEAFVATIGWLFGLLLMVVEFFLGRTDLVKSNSILESVLNVFKMILVYIWHASQIAFASFTL